MVRGVETEVGKGEWHLAEVERYEIGVMGVEVGLEMVVLEFGHHLQN